MNALLVEFVLAAEKEKSRCPYAAKVVIGRKHSLLKLIHQKCLDKSHWHLRK